MCIVKTLASWSFGVFNSASRFWFIESTVQRLRSVNSLTILRIRLSNKFENSLSMPYYDNKNFQKFWCAVAKLIEVFKIKKFLVPLSIHESLIDNLLQCKDKQNSFAQTVDLSWALRWRTTQYNCHNWVSWDSEKQISPYEVFYLCNC